LALFREEREVEIFVERVLRFGEIPNVSLFCERLLMEANMSLGIFKKVRCGIWNDWICKDKHLFIGQNNMESVTD
jgi:hypothetical protein